MRYVTDIGSDLDELLLQTVDRCVSFGVGRHLASHLAQPKSKRSDLLENTVVQFPEMRIRSASCALIICSLRARISV